MADNEFLSALGEGALKEVLEYGDAVERIVNLTKDANKFQIGAKNNGSILEYNKLLKEGTEKTIALSAATTDLSKTILSTDAALKNYGADQQKNIRVLIDHKAALAALNAQQKELEKSYKAGSVSADTYKSKLSNITAQQVELKAAMSELNSVIGAQAKANIAAEGSIDQLSAKLGQYRDIFRQLSAEDRNGAIGQGLLKSVQELDPAIKAFDASTGNFQRNVGNYASATEGMAMSFNSAVNVLREARAEMVAEMATAQKSGVQHQALAAQIENLDKILQGAETGFLKSKTAMQILTQISIDLQSSLGADSEAFIKISNLAGNYADELSDLKTKIKNLGSDTRGIDGLIQGAQALTGAWGIATGAATLFGDENKDLQKQMIKLQAVMTITMGIQQVVNALQKESALTLLILDARTKAVAAAMWLWNAATSATSGAMIALRSILISTGIGAIAVAIGLAVNAMSEWARSTENEADKQKQLADEIERTNRLMDEQVKKSETLRNAKKGGLDDLRRELEIAKAKKDNDKEVYELEKKILEQEIRNANVKKISFDGNAEKQAEAQKEIEDKKAQLQALGIKYRNDQQDKADKAADKSRQEREKSHRELYQKNIEAFKAQYDAQKTAMEEQAAYEKKIADDQKASLDDRLAAQQAYYTQKAALIEAEAEFEKMKAGNNLAAIQGIEATKNAKLKALMQERLDSDIILFQSAGDRQIQVLQDNMAKEISETEIQKSKKLKSLEELHKSGAISEEAYQKQVQDIERASTIERAKIEIKFTKELIQLKKARGEDTRALEEALAKFELEIVSASANSMEASVKKTKDILKDLKQLFIEAVNQSYGNQITAIDDSIAAVNEWKQAQTDAINQSTLDEKEKAAQLSAINIRAAAEEKRLANDKKRIQKDQARFNKYIAAAQIAISTYQAIMKNSAELGYVPSIPINILTGALGAAQIALVLGTKIPEYAKGTPEGGTPADGFARVAEGDKPEYIEKTGKRGYWQMKETVDWFPKGSKVTPLEKMAKRAGVGVTEMYEVYNSGKISNADVIQAVNQQTAALVSAILQADKKQDVDIINLTPTLPTDHFFKSIQHRTK